MADLSRDGDGRDRGQLLLVAALAIAVAIVALVLLLNTSIYMENLATRDTDTGANDAIAFRNSVESNLWRVVDAENERTYADRGELEANVSNRTTRFVRLAASRHRRAGVVASLSNTTFYNGTRLVQNDSTRQLTSASGPANWTLATGADGVREFEVDVTGGLETTSTPDTDAFAVDVEGSTGDRWRLYVYNNGGTRIAVKNGSGVVSTNACGGVPADPRVNLTAGTVNGTSCDAIDFANGADPPYDVSYRFGDRAEGTYRLTVNTSNVPTTAFNGPGPTTPPYEVPVVYSVSTDVVYRSSTLAYRANVTVTEGAG